MIRNKLLVILLLVFITSNAWGVTQLKKTVMPSGGDYTSLEACMNANEQNLVTADKYFDVEIDGSWSSADTTACTIHNYTTDATRYINIYTTATARHLGVWSTSYYIHQGNIDASAMTSGNITYNGLQFDINGTRQLYTYSSGSIVKNCIFNQTSATNVNAHCLLMRGGGYVYNCIFYKTGGAGTGGGADLRETTYLYNNTAYGFLGGVGFISSATTNVYKNNIAYNNGTDYTLTTIASTSTNNLAKDTSTPEYNTYYDSKTLTFVNVAGGNFHLASTDTDAIDKGADLSATFTDDIDGVIRSGTWDIGADEYVSISSRHEFFMVD